jgi:CBS domain-containing membrane protein
VSLYRLAAVVIAAKFLGEFSGVDEWLMAPLGTSTLLVFALPQSPMAQTWAVIAGNIFQPWLVAPLSSY